MLVNSKTLKGPICEITDRIQCSISRNVEQVYFSEHFRHGFVHVETPFDGVKNYGTFVFQCLKTHTWRSSWASAADIVTNQNLIIE